MRINFIQRYTTIPVLISIRWSWMLDALCDSSVTLAIPFTKIASNVESGISPSTHTRTTWKILKFFSTASTRECRATSAVNFNQKIPDFNRVLVVIVAFITLKTRNQKVQTHPRVVGRWRRQCQIGVKSKQHETVTSVTRATRYAHDFKDCALFFNAEIKWQQTDAFEGSPGVFWLFGWLSSVKLSVYPFLSDYCICLSDCVWGLVSA